MPMLITKILPESEHAPWQSENTKNSSEDNNDEKW